MSEVERGDWVVMSPGAILENSRGNPYLTEGEVLCVAHRNAAYYCVEVSWSNGSRNIYKHSQLIKVDV